MTLRRALLYAIAAIAVLLLGGRVLAAVYVDYQWYAALGASTLWREKAVTTAITRGGSGALAALFLFANMYAVRQSVESLILPRRVGNIEIAEEVPGHRMLGVAAAMALVIALFLTLPADSWIALSRVRHGLPFGEQDPYFEQDLGFWLYWLPLEQSIFLWALITILAATGVVIFLYALTPSLRWRRGSLYVSNYVRRHLAILAALLLVMLAWNYRLDAFGLLLQGSGADGAFSALDHRARLNPTIWLSVVTLVAALLTAWFGWSGQLRPAMFTVLGVLLLSIGVRHVFPAAMARIRVVHDAETRERPYVAIRAGYTRRAFALERVERSSSGLLFESAAGAARSVAAWDPAALAWAMGHGRPGGVPPAVGWAPSADGLIAVIVQPPAVGTAQRAEGWAIIHTLATAADSRGDPIVVGADGRPFPRESRTAPVIVHPDAAGLLVIDDPVGHVAAPPLRDFSSRLAHAWSMQNLPLLFGEQPRVQPRIVTRRDVLARVRALAPFHTTGTSVTPLVAADTVHWLVDLYSTSRSYPLSDRVLLGGREYRFVQRALTAIVNGSTGRVFLVADPGYDPVTRGLLIAFPELYTSWDRIPDVLVSVVPPAADEGRVHAAVLARYSFRGEPLRRGRPAGGESPDTLLERAPLAAFMLPSAAGLGVSHAVLDAHDRLAGLVVATGGSRRASHWLPLEEDGARWSTLLDMLQRTLDTIADFPRDARAARGRLRAVPAGEEPLLVQPLYAWREERPPVLSRVAVIARGRVHLGPSLAGALGVPDPAVAALVEPLGADQFRRRVVELYDAMRSAMQRGDWNAFGSAYEELGNLLQRTAP